jgi:thioredoxin reductase (NADPH)
VPQAGKQVYRPASKIIWDFPRVFQGKDLTGRGFKQATRFDAEIALTRSVEKLTTSSEGYVCEFDGGQLVSARAVVLATSVDWRRLQAKGEDRLLGRGIFYGAARQEATNVVGKKVFIVGGGNSAGQAACFCRAMRLKERYWCGANG